jgi:thiol-disulfide isomerase/thioredoxin
MTASNKKTLLSLPLIIGIIAGAAGIYWFQSGVRKDEVKQVVTETTGELSKSLATGKMAALLIPPQRKDIAAFTFTNAKNETIDLGKWKGRVVLLNLWAIWCTPCRKEMPELAALQKQMGGPDFEVLPLSVDRKGIEASQAFLKDIAAENLTAYSDVEATSLAALQGPGLPITVIVDRNGKEAARLIGPADWASPEAQAVIKALIDEKP